MAKEYGPQYYIRIFPRLGDVRVLNPNNVISITTSKDIYQLCGTWGIEFDYREGAMEQNSWFFNIEPMDYVEIFMRREPIYAVDENGVERDWGFGVYTSNPGGMGGVIECDDGRKRWAGKWLGTFDVVALEGLVAETVINSNSQLGFGGVGLNSIINSPLSTKQRPLNIEEKINNPDFIMCGFVDRITNRFSISDSGTHNLIRLEGRGVEKILAVHNFFFNIQYQATWLKKMISSFLYIPQMTPCKAIDFILTVFLQGALDPQGDTMEFDKLERGITGRDYQVKLVKEKSKETVIKWNPKLKRNETVTQDKVKELPPIIIHDGAPTCNHIYWALTNDKKYTWGRMFDLYQDAAKAVGNIANGAVWSIMQQFCNSALNELWVDETGNVVCRSVMSAWSQPAPDEENTTKSNNKFFDYHPWVTVTSGEIRSWDFTRSDDDLKTIVQVVPSASVLGTVAITSGLYGQAPITETSKNFMLETIQKAIDDKTSQITPENRAIAIKQLQILQQELDAAQNRIVTNVSSYRLSKDSDVQKFWSRFGMRPFQVNDIYSTLPVNLVRTAGIVFQFWANTFWNGNLTVRGDSRFKLGRMVNCPDFNKNVRGIDGEPLQGGAVFYCHKVEHNFTWGEDWTTTLGLTRGQLRDHYTDLRVLFNTPNTNSYTVPPTGNTPA